MVEHEKPDCGRKIALAPLTIDFADQVGKGRVAASSNLLQCLPKCIFQTDACFVTCDYDGPFYDWRLQSFLLRRLRITKLHALVSYSDQNCSTFTGVPFGAPNSVRAAALGYRAVFSTCERFSGNGTDCRDARSSPPAPVPEVVSQAQADSDTAEIVR